MRVLYTWFFALILFPALLFAQNERASNPIIFADVPDLSMIRVGETYYMSSTTMHMSPGVPIMKSSDLVNWELVNYAYHTLVDNPAMNLDQGQNSYGKGSWASCLRYHDGIFFLSTFAATSGKTHIFKTSDIENGTWEEISFEPSYHDHTIYFEEDKTYMIWGAGDLMIVELEKDLSGVRAGTERVLVENASVVAGENIGLPAEGSQIFKKDNYYYLLNITWPKGGMRTVLVHRSEKITGPYEGKVALQDRGIAQGGLIDTPDGNWFAYLFRDYGAVGRIPYLVPVDWVDGWPVLGEEGKVPDFLDLPSGKRGIPMIVATDDFVREDHDYTLPLVWQWNHNPINTHWSLKERPGFLRLRNDRIDSHVLETRNTLTQRTFGPKSNAITKLDFTGLKEGDNAGMILLQKEYGFIGVKRASGKSNLIVEISGEITAQIPLEGNIVYLKAACDFENMKDQARFYYSLDGENWEQIGDILSMKYTLPHFMGYRFGLFSFGTQSEGGFADFEFFKIEGEGRNDEG